MKKALPTKVRLKTPATPLYKNPKLSPAARVKDLLRRMTLEEGIASASQQARRYAKRQMTWFRRETGAQGLRLRVNDLDADEVAVRVPGGVTQQRNHDEHAEQQRRETDRGQRDQQCAPDDHRCRV